MAAIAPFMSFLRPLGPPRSSTVRQFLRFSTSSRCCAETASKPSLAQEDANLIASRTASPSYPPPSMTSPPRPKESRSSRRSSHPTKTRDYPTRHPTHHPIVAKKLIPEPVEPLAAELCAPNLPYFVTRTPSNELPIYPLTKRSGSMKLTRIKKIDGKATVLRDELRSVLNLPDKDAVINSVTGHIILKGHHKPVIEKFLRERLF